MPDTKACHHEFPVQPPEGSWANPGPCTWCGQSWDRTQAEKALKEAQAAMEATS